MMEQQQETSLVLVAPDEAMTVFTSAEKIEMLVARVGELATEAADGLTVETAEGRAQLKAIAYKVKRSKSYLDGVGKGLVDELKDLPKRIDLHRKLARESLDRLHDEIRGPLTEWEIERERIKQAEARAEQQAREKIQQARVAIEVLKFAPVEAVGKPSTVVQELIDGFESTPPTVEIFGEVFDQAQGEWLNTLDKLRHILEQTKATEDRERIDRERKIADDAARAEREASEQKLIAEKIAVERANQARKEADERAAASEKARIESEARAAKQAELAAAQAAEQERQRQAAEIERQRLEAEARAADKEHKKSVNNAAVNGLITHAGLTVEQARAVVKAVVSNNIPHVSITY